MKRRLNIGVLISFVSLFVFAGKPPKPYKTEQLGHGYKLVWVAYDQSDCKDCFEGTAHGTDLYYGSQKLGEVGQYSISPSGRYAIFEQDGRLVVFSRDSKRKIDVTDGEFAVPADFKWNEKTPEVNVTYTDDKHSPSKIKLPDSKR